jgi:hypothetical protein
MVWCLIRQITLPFTPAVIYSEMKSILKRLPYLFLKDLLAAARCSISVLETNSGKVILFSCPFSSSVLEFSPEH